MTAKKCMKKCTNCFRLPLGNSSCLFLSLGSGFPIPISGFDPLRLDNRKVETEVSPCGQVEDALN